MSYTRVHTHISFANPYLRCDECGKRVRGYHAPDRCGCEGLTYTNIPCGHKAGATSICPSWGPVSGCSCAEFLGEIPCGIEPTS